MRIITTILFIHLSIYSFSQKPKILIDTVKWDNGKIKSIGQYLEKVDVQNRHGHFQFFYETGELEESRYYKNGTQDSLLIGYYKNGNKKKEGLLRPCRVGKWITWFENGQKESEGEWDCNIHLKEWSYWDSSGHIIKQILFSNAAYKSVIYDYQDGILRRISRWKGVHLKNANKTFYRKDGGSFIATFTNDFSRDYKQIPVGIWKIFDVTCKLIEEEKYED